jgi:WD40 repeat protein
LQVLSSSLDGTLRQWDIQEGTCLQTWTIGQPIESMVSCVHNSSSSSSSSSVQSLPKAQQNCLLQCLQ